MVRPIPAFLLRFLYLCLILYLAASGSWTGATFNALIFLVTLPLLLLFRRDPQFGHLDAGFTTLFFVPLFLGVFFDYSLASSTLGPDKLFHAAAGFLLAWTAWLCLGLRRRAPRSLVRVALSLSFALLIGVGWEGYEWLFHLFAPMGLTLLDSSLDIIADMLGAGLAIWLLTSRKL